MGVPKNTSGVKVGFVTKKSKVFGLSEADRRGQPKVVSLSVVKNGALTYDETKKLQTEAEFLLENNLTLNIKKPKPASVYYAEWKVLENQGANMDTENDPEDFLKEPNERKKIRYAREFLYDKLDK